MPKAKTNKKKSNKIPLEIERKFLLKRLPKNVLDKYKKGLHILNIVQYYYFIDNTWQRFREVKETGKKTKHIHTIKKSISLGTYEELEKGITEKLFKQRFKENSKNHAVIRKTRYVVKHKGFKFEIDVYLDLSLVVLEVELLKLNQHFEYPDGLFEEIIMEVTGMKQFSNLSLSKKVKK